MSNDTATDCSIEPNRPPPQTDHIDIEDGRIVQRPRVEHTSDPRGKPTWVEDMDAVLEYTDHTVVESDEPYASVISDGSRKGWIVSDTFSYVDDER